jgi:phosphoglycerate kinase
MQKMPFKSITQQSDLAGKYIFLRASINVPIKDGVVRNQFRITRGLATVRYLTSKGARVILAGHIGSDGSISAKPVADIFASHVPTVFSKQVLGAQTQNLRDYLKNGEVLVLENLRSNDGEKKNDMEFAKDLAALADIYINDAFSASHREHASLSAITQFLPSYVGMNFVHEYEELTKALTPEAPSLFLLGGAKFDTKMPLVEKFLDIYDTVFIGGALANDFFKAKGLEVGNSLVSQVSLAKSPLLNHKKILLPIDVTVEKDGVSRVTSIENVHPDERILDTGPKTVAILQQYITGAKMVLWNGPFGDYEHGFEEQTIAVAKSIAQANGYSVIGGGDTVAAIEELNCQEKYNFLSTAGGAMLTFLELGTLPAIEALKKAPNME